MEDQSKFFNVIIDRTNQKLNSFQAQVIVLESQLQMANDERDMYKKYVEELPALNLNIEEHNKLKNDYTLLEARFQAVLEEQEKRHQEVLNNLNLQHQEIMSSLKIQLHDALTANSDYIEKIKILQSNNSNDTRFIRDQNETLLQEIRRLKAEMAEMSTRK
jgi:hypothetical protein